MRSSPEERFVDELEYLRREVEGGMQMLFAHFAFQEIVARDSKILSAVNETPVLWATTLYSWQCGYFICLHRIFDDKNSRYHVGRVLGLARDNIGLFSKAALSERKRRESANADEFLPALLSRAYEPSVKDINRLETGLATHKDRYNERYRKLRNKIFAHRDIADPEKVSELLSHTRVQEMRNMYLFLLKLHEALWQLFHNGRKPILRPIRYSIRDLVGSSLSSSQTQLAHARICLETRDLLKSLVS